MENPINLKEIEQRKQFFTELQKKMPEFKTYFVSGASECELQNDSDWENQCITLAYEVNPVCMLAVTWNAGLYQNEYGKEMLEIGFRKHFARILPDENFYKQHEEAFSGNSLGVPANLNQWWYQCKLIDVDANEVSQIFSQMITFCKIELEECNEDE